MPLLLDIILLFPSARVAGSRSTARSHNARGRCVSSGTVPSEKRLVIIIRPPVQTTTEGGKLSSCVCHDATKMCVYGARACRIVHARTAAHQVGRHFNGKLA